MFQLSQVEKLEKAYVIYLNLFLIFSGIVSRSTIRAF